MTTFDEVCDRVYATIAEHNLGVYGSADLGIRIELPLCAWHLLKDYADRHYSWATSGPPMTAGYRLFGYPFVIDPNLPNDAIRVVTVASSVDTSASREAE